MPAKKETVQVTPQIAKDLLKKNVRNRDIVLTRVKSYAELMKAGRWDPDADQPIKLGDQNKVLDGQHRLLAIIEADRTIQMDIWWGCSDQSQYHMDAGTPRRLSGHISMNGGKYASTTAAAVLRLYQFETYGSLFRNNKTVDYLLCAPLLTKYGIEGNAASIDVMSKKAENDLGACCLTPTIATTLLCLLQQTAHSSQAIEFMQGVFYSATDDKDPRLVLRRTLLKRKLDNKHRTRQAVLMDYCILAWNKFVAKEKIQSLKLPKKPPTIAGLAMKVVLDDQVPFEEELASLQLDGFMP